MSDIIEIDVNTGEVTSRNYTKKEIDYKKYLEENLVLPEPIVDTYAEVRASALAKLMSLGLSEEEARVIAGV